MQVILTPTAVPDKFGPGLHGFQGVVPGPPTQISPEWLDSVQMELVYPLLDQGFALDSLNLGQLTIALNSWKWSGTPTLLNGAQLFVNGGGTIEVESGGTFIMAPGSTGSFLGSATFSDFLTVAAAGTFVCNGLAGFNGNVIIGNSGTNTFTVDVASTFNDTTEFTADVSITNNATLTAGKVKLSPAIAPSGERELVADSNGNLVYQPTADPSPHYVHHSKSGWTYATGEQEAETAMAGVNTSLVTAERCTPQSIDVLVVAEGWGQMSVAANQVVMQMQYDNGAGVYSDVGTSVAVEWVDTSNPLVWSFFRISRRLTPNTSINRLYRLKLTPDAGQIKIREATIRVVNPQR